MVSESLYAWDRILIKKTYETAKDIQNGIHKCTKAQAAAKLETRGTYSCESSHIHHHSSILIVSIQFSVFSSVKF